MTAARRDEKIAALIDECGIEGYGFYWLLVETVAELVGKNDQKCEATYSLPQWSRLLYSHHHRVSNLLGKLEGNGLVRLSSVAGKITVIIPNLLKYRDEYSKKSGVNPESVRSNQKIHTTDGELETHTQGNPEKTNLSVNVKNGPLMPVKADTDPLSEEVKLSSAEIHGGHPKARRDISVSAVEKSLWVIVDRHAKRHGKEREELLMLVLENHRKSRASPAWTKDGGNWAKGLENWLSPTKDRYMQSEISELREPSPSHQPGATEKSLMFFEEFERKKGKL